MDFPLRVPSYQAATQHACQAARLNLSNHQDNPDSHEMDTPALRGVNNTGDSTQRQLVSYKQVRLRHLLTQPLTAPLPDSDSS